MQTDLLDGSCPGGTPCKADYSRWRALAQPSLRIGVKIWWREAVYYRAMFLFILFWIVLALVVGVLAVGRGRKGFGWTILACLISPPLAAAFLFAIADRSPHAREPVPPTHLVCLHCDGRILRDARVCRHCGADVAA